jgi:hypothetical protein
MGLCLIDAQRGTPFPAYLRIAFVSFLSLQRQASDAIMDMAVMDMSKNVYTEIQVKRYNLAYEVFVHICVK